MTSSVDNEKSDLNSSDSATTSMRAICNDTTTSLDESLASYGSPEDRSSDEEVEGDEYIPEESDVSSIDTSATEEILEEEEEIPVPTTKKRNAKVMKAETAPKRSTSRELKETKRFEAVLPPKKNKKAKKAAAIQKKVDSGNGQKLGKIPFIKEKLATTSPNDLIHVHHVCFGRKGNGSEVVKNLRAFSGFPFDEDSDEFTKRKAVISRSLEVKNLKVVCSVLGVAQGKKKEETIRNILEFCLYPEDDGQDPNSKKRSPTTTKAKTKLAANGKEFVSKNDESGDKENSEVEVDDPEPPKKKSLKAADKSKYKVNFEQEADDGDVSEQGSDKDEQKKKRKKKRASKKATPKIPKKGKKFTRNEAMVKKSKESESDSEQSEEIDVENEDSGLEDSVASLPSPHPSSLDINKVTSAEMKKIVKQIIKKADLHTFSMNDMMEEVKRMFNIDINVKLNSKIQSQVRKFVGEYLN